MTVCSTVVRDALCTDLVYVITAFSDAIESVIDIEIARVISLL